MGIQISDIVVNATQIFDVVFSEVYRARGGTRQHGRSGGLTVKTTLTSIPLKKSAVLIGDIKGYVPQLDENVIPDFLEGRGNDGNTYVFRRTDVQTKGGSLVANYRVTVNLPSPGPLRRIAHAVTKTNQVQARLIKIPPLMERLITERLYFETCWRLRDKFTARTKVEFAAHWKALQAVIAEHGLKIPNSTAGSTNDSANLTTFTVPVSTEGMPANYQNLRSVQPLIRVGFNWTGKIGGQHKTLAFWWPQKNLLMVNFFNADEFQFFPSSRFGPDVISYLLRHTVEAVQHELRHVVQTLFLDAVDQKQSQKAPDYHKFGDGYYASPIELDPTVGSMAFEFVEYWRVHLEHGRRTTEEDRKRMMKEFVGAVTPNNRIVGLSVHPFFAALRQRDIVKWRLSVKKFFVEVEALLAKQETVATIKRKIKDVPRDPLGFPIFLTMKEKGAKKTFFITPDDVKLMKNNVDYDGIARAARRIYGDHNDIGTSNFEYGLRLGYQRVVDSFNFKFDDQTRKELVTEYGTGDEEQDSYMLDEAEGIVADAIRCGSSLRAAHEWYLESGQWETPYDGTRFFDVYKPEKRQ